MLMAWRHRGRARSAGCSAREDALPRRNLHMRDGDRRGRKCAKWRCGVCARRKQEGKVIAVPNGGRETRERERERERESERDRETERQRERGRGTWSRWWDEGG